MVVSIRLFAGLRERAGAGTVEVELPVGASVEDVLGTEALRGIVGEIPCVLAVNREYASAGQVLRPGDELALIPPVSGGSDAIFVELSDEPLSRDALAARVRDPRAGAELLFTGLTREVERLEYEAYPEMALRMMRDICADAAEQHGLCRVAAVHRVGPVPLSEPCVIVAVSAPHREEAFAGGRQIIDAVKATAPIWKTEVAGGEHRRPAGAIPAPEGSRA